MPGTVYLICLDTPFGHARHYIGWSRWLRRRLAHHVNGTGCWFLKKVGEAGITWTVVRTWKGATRTFERSLKGRGATRYCPRCTGPAAMRRKAEYPSTDHTRRRFR